MSKAFFHYLTATSSFIVLLPLLVAALKMHRLTRIQKKVLLLLLVMLITEGISNVFWYKEWNNLPVYHVYTVLEFVLILNIYAHFLLHYVPRKAIVAFAVLFAGFSIVNALFFQSIYTLNSNTITVLSYTMIALALASYYDLLKHSKSSVFKTETFFISTGILMYYSCNLILFYINNSLELTVSQSFWLWGAHAVTNILLILFYTFAIWMQPTKA